MDVLLNAEATLRALDELAKKNQSAVKYATKQVGMEAARIMKKQIIGKHPLGTSRYSDAARGIVDGRPSNVTGNLRRAIRPKETEAFGGKYVVVVGSYQIYARRLELEYGYQFVAPTATILRENNKARTIYVNALRHKLFH